jgi:uncharacterized membrane protein required for colicin V production
MKNTLIKTKLALYFFIGSVLMAASEGHAATLKDWIGNLKNNAITPLFSFLQLLALVGGICLILFGGLQGWKKSRGGQMGQQVNVGEILGSILVGVILISVFAFANMASETVTGSSMNVESNW